MAAPRPEPLTRSRFIAQALLAALVMGLSFSSYLVVLKSQRGSNAWSTQLPWEAKWIPFHPAWVYVYLVPYVIGPLLLGLLSRRTFQWYVRRGLLLVAVSVTIFALFPTSTVRPRTAQLGDSITAMVYQNMIGIDDPPVNAAPSLHVSLTFLLVLALLFDFPRWWILFIPGVALVWLATLLTWQHHLVDVLSGALLGGIIALPWSRRLPRSAAVRISP